MKTLRRHGLVPSLVLAIAACGGPTDTTPTTAVPGTSSTRTIAPETAARTARVAPPPGPTSRGAATPSAKAADGAVAPVVFGLYPSDNPTEMHRQFLPLVDYLSRTTELPMELRVAPGYAEAVQWIQDGKVDFFRSGAAFYGALRAQPSGRDYRLVAVELWEGETSFRGAIVVPESSTAESLADLRGRSFAFGDPKSTMGFLLPSRLLELAGVPLTALGRYEHLKSHDDVALAVANGMFDAGACKAPTAEKYRARGIRTLDVADLVSPSKPIFARPGVDASTVQKVRDALLALGPKNDEHAKVLSAIEKKLTGYAEGNPLAYEAFARRFGATTAE